MRAAEGDAWAQEYLLQIETQTPLESHRRACISPEFKAWMQSAEEGNPKAQFLLGWEYANGKEEFRNLKAAEKWFRRAAEQGYVPAQRELGCLYYEGEGVAIDREEARHWWELAADNGDRDAMACLGYYYHEAAPDAPDYASVEKWWRLAAERGDGTSAYNLYIFYEKGDGGRKDEEEALQWLRHAAELGDAKSQYGVYLKSGGTELYWLLCAAEQGFRDAEVLIKECQIFRDENGQLLIDLVTPGALQFLLGVFHEEGRLGAEANMKIAVEWYLKAAEKGYADALYRMGECYEHGTGVEADPIQAHNYYHRAAEQGHKNARTKLNEL